MNFEQEIAVKSLPKLPTCIIAGPGSGKTYTLVQRIVFLHGSQQIPMKSLMLTFSKSAAMEMSHRLMKHEIHGVDVLTFHSFSFRLINANWKALGYSARPKIPKRRIMRELLQVG